VPGFGAPKTQDPILLEMVSTVDLTISKCPIMYQMSPSLRSDGGGGKVIGLRWTR